MVVVVVGVLVVIVLVTHVLSKGWGRGRVSKDGEGVSRPVHGSGPALPSQAGRHAETNIPLPQRVKRASRMQREQSALAGTRI